MNLQNRKIWLDGKFVPWGKATVHLMSHSFTRGSAVFEVMSIHPVGRNGAAIWRLDDHLDRLRNSARLIAMPLAFSLRALRQAALAAVAQNRLQHGFVKLLCYYPEVEFEVIPRSKKTSIAIVAVNPAADLHAAFYRGGRPAARAAVSKWRKLDPATVPIHCKAAANYLSPLVAKQEVMARGFDIPILLTTGGFVAEGATESLFLVKSRVIKTAPLDFVLPGITRRSVIEVARWLGFKVVEKKMRLPELMAADEAFYTSTSFKVWPIASIERKKLPVPGPVAAHLMEAFQEITSGQAPRFRKWLAVAPRWK
jgi:branched-chain amino acid aminotransferase